MPHDLFSVKDKIVVLTGGLGQLGRQFALALEERGARVAVLDNRVDEARVRQRFGDRARNERFLFLSADVTVRATLEKALERIRETWAEPDVLINNAALDSPPDSAASENGPFETYSESSWDQMMAVNLKGVFLCCQTFGGAMAEAGSGSIINISSIYGLVSPNQTVYDYRRANGEIFFKPAAYSVSKSGLLNLTRYLSTYWAEKGVRVNTLTFAGVHNNQDERFLQGYLRHMPLGRMAREDEYNGAVIFLASDASSYMTGANLIIDGGWTAW